MTISAPQNIFSNIPTQLTEELFETLHQQDNIQVERIISKGQHTPEHEWYDQPQDEWVLLLQGQAELEFSEPHSVQRLMPGDYLLIPAHVKHRVAWTPDDSVTVWLAIHIFPDGRSEG